MMSFPDLPADIILEIAHNLEYRDAVRLCQTCQTFYHLFRIENFGHIWQFFYRQTISAIRIPNTISISTQGVIMFEFAQYFKKSRFLKAVRQGYEVLAKSYFYDLASEYRDDAIVESLYDAARFGYSDILDWLLSFNPRQLYLASEGAAAAGNYDLVDRLLPQISTRHLGPTIQAAAKADHRDILVLLFRLNHSIHFAIIGAAEGNQRQLLEKLLQQQPDYEAAIHGAALGGHEGLVKELCNNAENINFGINMIVQGAAGAAQGDHAELTQWFLDQGAHVDINIPVRYGSRKVLDLLLQYYDPNCWPLLNVALDFAITKGYIDIVKRLLQVKPCYHLDHAICMATRSGYPEIATFLRGFEGLQYQKDSKESILSTQ